MNHRVLHLIDPDSNEVRCAKCGHDYIENEVHTWTTRLINWENPRPNRYVNCSDPLAKVIEVQNS